MNIDTRESRNKQSMEVLRELVQLATAQGVFKLVKAWNTDDDAAWRCCDVETPDGLRYSLRAGGWNNEGKISASVASIEMDGMRALPSDVLEWLPEARSRETSPEAAASYTRGAAIVLRELKRRIFDNADAQRIAGKVRKHIDGLLAQRDRLNDHIDALTKLGYSFGERRKDKSYDANAYAQLPHLPSRIRVTNEGRITFEATVAIEDFEAIVQAMKLTRD